MATFLKRLEAICFGWFIQGRCKVYLQACFIDVMVQYSVDISLHYLVHDVMLAHPCSDLVTFYYICWDGRKMNGCISSHMHIVSFLIQIVTFLAAVI